MKNIRDTLVILAAIAVIGQTFVREKVLAQNPALTPFVITEAAPCKGNFTAQAGVSAFCFGNDVAEYSIAGGPVTIFVPAASAATGVISVNGKTGAVTLGATTTLQ